MARASPTIAFFDVDKTVLAVNSASLWVRRELAAGNITRLQALKAGFWVTLYHLGFARMDDVLTEAVTTLKGRVERDVIERTLAFYRDDVQHTIQPAARAAVLRHKERGDLVFLLTSSSNYLSAPIADELKADGFLANRFVVDAGRFTGLAHMPLCFGKGKVAHAQVVAEKLRIDLKECAFYTDSVSDLPMLEAVGVPVAVDPDPRLRRIARRRGWAIEAWRQPIKALTT
ncbi:MAG: HAD family hydrolase [Deltaproteobacteria bacterium]|nr:HAD family hydrolase [Deltaproteobacteria bacterium]